jgi:hypothetical protein
MDVTEYILSIISSNSNIVVIKLSEYANRALDISRLPANITFQEWQEDWCEGRDVDNATVIRFRP